MLVSTMLFGKRFSAPRALASRARSVSLKAGVAWILLCQRVHGNSGGVAGPRARGCKWGLVNLRQDQLEPGPVQAVARSVLTIAP